MKKFSSTMRGNSRRTLRNKRIKNILLLGLVGVFLVVVVPFMVRGIAAVVMQPIVWVDNWLTTSEQTVPAYLRDRADLIEQITQLERQVVALETSSSTIQYLTQENADLRALLGDTESERIAAAVIARPPDTLHDVFVLDRGRNAGVEVGAPVYMSSTTVIGTVTTVFNNTSVVELVTTPGLESTVYVVGPNIYTTATGIGGGILSVGVPQGIDLSVGDQVVVPAFSAGIYGVVTSVDSVSTRPEQYGYVATDIPLQQVRYVTIGRTPVTPMSFESARAVIETVRNSRAVVPVPEGVLIDITDVSEVASSSATSTAATTTDNPEAL